MPQPLSDSLGHGVAVLALSWYRSKAQLPSFRHRGMLLAECLSLGKSLDCPSCWIVDAGHAVVEVSNGMRQIRLLSAGTNCEYYEHYG